MDGATNATATTANATMSFTIVRELSHRELAHRELAHRELAQRELPRRGVFTTMEDRVCLTLTHGRPRLFDTQFACRANAVLHICVSNKRGPP